MIAAAAAAVAASDGSAPAPTHQADDAGYGPWLLLLFAFLGGIVLNVMPCVLPVLSIKVLGLVQQADADRRTIAVHGVAYTVGILASFGALAGLIVALQASGALVGWGFQFQSPGFVAALAAIVFAFALSLFGVFEVTLPGAGAADRVAASRHGYGGSFANGVFATLLATPCTAPLLAPAMGFALTQPPALLTAFLLTVGLGLAFPFMLLAAFPRWVRLVPRPGPWMDTFKKAMGFLLVATAVWLIDVLAYQVSSRALVGFLAFLGFVSLAAWIYGHWGGPVRAARTRWIAVAVAVATLAGGASATLSLEPAGPTSAEETAGGITWRDFAATDVEALATAGQTVLIDFTARWCVTCKVYERTVIETDAVRALLTELAVVPVKADYTNEDPEITRWLRRFGRSGVPMYVILPAGRAGQPILLPDLLTQEALLDGLRRAGPSVPPPSPPGI